MAGKVLSIYISNEEIRACELTKTGANVSVRRAFKLRTPGKAMDDGQIMDAEELAKVLQEGMAANGIKKSKLAFVISSRKIANKEITVPYIRNKSKVGDIVNANLDEYFPMNNLEDYVFRHTILDTFENAEGKHYSVLVTAVHKQMIEGYYSLAALLKMSVETVDYYGNSIYQLLKKQLNQGTVLGLQMDRDVTYVSIMKGQAQLFRRSVPYGKDAIVQSLATHKGMPEADAEKILMDPEKLDKTLSIEEYNEIIKEFAAAISRVVEFHTSRNPGTLIELCKLMGSGIGMAGFADVLSRELGIEIVTIKEPENIKIYKKNMDGLNYENIVDYLPNIGLLFNSLNLKAGEEKKSPGFQNVMYALMAAAVVVDLAAAVTLLIQYNG